MKFVNTREGFFLVGCALIAGIRTFGYSGKILRGEFTVTRLCNFNVGSDVSQIISVKFAGLFIRVRFIKIGIMIYRSRLTRIIASIPPRIQLMNECERNGARVGAAKIYHQLHLT